MLVGQSDQTRCGTSQAAAEQVAIHGAEGHTWQENSSKSNLFPWSRRNIKMLVYEENYRFRDKTDWQISAF